MRRRRARSCVSVFDCGYGYCFVFVFVSAAATAPATLGARGGKAIAAPALQRAACRATAAVACCFASARSPASLGAACSRSLRSRSRARARAAVQSAGCDAHAAHSNCSVLEWGLGAAYYNVSVSQMPLAARISLRTACSGGRSNPARFAHALVEGRPSIASQTRPDYGFCISAHRLVSLSYE